MTDSKHTVSFVFTDHAPVEVPADKALSEVLTVQNSPVLFGCRSGLCGACVCEITQGYDKLAPPDTKEKEVLELFADDVPTARLACQIELTADITVAPLDG